MQFAVKEISWIQYCVGKLMFWTHKLTGNHYKKNF